MPDQTAVRITHELVKIFSALGIPIIVHSDQGQNFESAVLKQTLSAFWTVTEYLDPHDIWSPRPKYFRNFWTPSEIISPIKRFIVCM